MFNDLKKRICLVFKRDIDDSTIKKSTLKKRNIGESFVYYDDNNDIVGGNTITPEIRVTTKKDYRKVKLILSKVRKYISEGENLVIPELKEQWANVVIDSFKFEEEDYILYNGMIIEAIIDCMNNLSKGCEIKEVYSLIDYNNEKAEYFGRQITKLQNLYVTNIIALFHQRGPEFRNYHNHQECSYLSKAEQDNEELIEGSFSISSNAKNNINNEELFGIYQGKVKVKK